MRTFLFFVGKVLQVIGMGTVLIAFLSFFYNPSMGEMFRLTFLGVVEFYVGNLIVSKTGVRKNSGKGDLNAES